MNFIKKIFSPRLLIPVVVLVLAAAGAKAMIDTAPKNQKKKPRAVIPTVETAVFARGSHPVSVEVMGTVVAAREITLEARVSGQVRSVSPTFIPGGYFRKGQEVLRIDPTDYELAVDETRAGVAEAEYNLKVEQGYQKVADREWKLLMKSRKGAVGEAELALRKPHLKKALADVEAARAGLDQARLDLERTSVRSPFPAMVESKSTDVGAMVSTQESLATLVGTDEFWVQVSVPVDRLERIEFPTPETPGAEAVIICGSNGHAFERRGRVLRLLPSLESQGRMARVLISVKDPLNLRADPELKPLLLGSYAKVSIRCADQPGSFSIPRRAFRDNGRIWVLLEDGSLDIRDVSPVWRDSESVLLTEGLSPGERVVVSAISAPMRGMKLRAEGEKPRAGADGGGKKPGSGTPGSGTPGQGRGQGKGQGRGGVSNG